MAKLYAPDHGYATSEDCAAALPSFIRAGDFVFLKGSASVKLHRVMEALATLAPSLATTDPTRGPGGGS